MKRPSAARDWSEAKTLTLLGERINKLAPNNAAEIPLACSQLLQPDGSIAWLVNVHVKIIGSTEYDIEAAGSTLAGALRRAYLGLNNETNLRRHAASANQNFGISV